MDNNHPLIPHNPDEHCKKRMSLLSDSCVWDAKCIIMLDWVVRLIKIAIAKSPRATRESVPSNTDVPTEKGASVRCWTTCRMDWGDYYVRESSSLKERQQPKHHVQSPVKWLHPTLAAQEAGPIPTPYSSYILLVARLFSTDRIASQTKTAGSFHPIAAILFVKFWGEERRESRTPVQKRSPENDVLWWNDEIEKLLDPRSQKVVAHQCTSQQISHEWVFLDGTTGASSRPNHETTGPPCGTTVFGSCS